MAIDKKYGKDSSQVSLSMTWIQTTLKTLVHYDYFFFN